jgi:hypothetical protein
MNRNGENTGWICLVKRMGQVCCGWTINAFMACKILDDNISVYVGIGAKDGPFVGDIITPITGV